MRIERGWSDVLDTLVRDPDNTDARAWADEAAHSGRGTPGQVRAYDVLRHGNDLLTTLNEGPAAIRAILTRHSITPTDRQPEPGEWSPRQIVHHLADNECVNAVRIRSILTEDTPEIFGYDSDPWTRFFDAESTEEALHRFEIQRKNTVRVLRSLSAEDLDRKGVLSYRGAESVRVLAVVLAGHDLDHMQQLSTAFEILEAEGAR